MSDLFPDEPIPHEITIPWTLDGAIRVFLHRWSWRGDKAVIEKELRELIAEAKKE